MFSTSFSKLPGIQGSRFPTSTAKVPTSQERNSTGGTKKVLHSCRTFPEELMDSWFTWTRTHTYMETGLQRRSFAYLDCILPCLSSSLYQCDHSIPILPPSTRRLPVVKPIGYATTTFWHLLCFLTTPTCLNAKRFCHSIGWF